MKLVNQHAEFTKKNKLIASLELAFLLSFSRTITPAIPLPNA